MAKMLLLGLCVLRFSVKLPKVGRLNLYGLYYGLTSIFLGLIWTVANTAVWAAYGVVRRLLRITSFDANRHIPLFFAHCWGVALLRLTGCYPKITVRPGAPSPTKFFSAASPIETSASPSTAVMYVGNHCSWMDIPYMGVAIGWRNYKIIAKKELTAVPILGQSIKLAGHVLVDRKNRRSQIATLKKGIATLQSNIPLCSFPEGTRSRTGRLMPFKRGSFSMAVKANAAVVPLSIVGAEKVMPTNWVMPLRPSSGVPGEIIVHPPISSVGKTEAELTEAVRRAIISGLPDQQRPVEA
ncbi:hypothetical protein TeGR_g1266 [Tetraparma gracilis]|uniref:1-acyl-sn-glycerol-3-phosphate acyltransferase n=1 Tax=Tetraparma gracilis TaxID=2962635 RepID=A0ABQ6M6Z8_9STRA|nr:hypothetical protein TeGR_g1266 [Tetraparma gracilis]